MEDTDYKMIIDKTFMLLDQAISEKKAEQATQKRSDQSCNFKKNSFKNHNKAGLYERA